MELSAALCIRPGVTAIIGSGGKTTLLYALARVLSADARVLVCTTTHILPPEHMPVLLCPSESALRAALQAQSPVCTASGMENGKLLPPSLPFERLAGLADYVLAEADGSHCLPAKAHAPHEPVVPREANQTICVFGLSALGRLICEAAHRPALYAEKLGVSPDEVLTPELAARLLRLEALHTRVFLNQADTPETEALGRRMAAELPCPVCIGALQKGSLQLC